MRITWPIKHFLEPYRQIFTTPKRYVLVRGGTRSGKTYGVSEAIVRMSLELNPGETILVMRKHQRYLRDSVFAEVCAAIRRKSPEFQKLFTIYTGNLQIHCRNGAKILFYGLEDPNRIKSIAGVVKIWFEEADAFTFSDFTEANRRFTETQTNQQIFLTFNPTSTSNWLYKTFYEKSFYRDNLLDIHVTYKDNPHLSKQTIAEIERMKDIDEYQYQVYALGNWGTLTNGIYSSTWNVFENLPNIPDQVFYGLDFGYNNPSAMVRVSKVDGCYYIEELIYSNKLNTDELMQQIALKNVNKVDSIYCDHASPEKIDELTKRGYNAKPAHKEVHEGIMYIKSLSDRIYVESSAENILRELSGYKWAEDRNGNALEKPVKINDHAMDAIRYAIYTNDKHHKEYFSPAFYG